MGKQTQPFVFIRGEFWEILMCSWTACSTSKDSLFSTSFTGYPSTVTFYEVQLQLLLLLHQRHNVAKWCRDSRLAGSWSGRYYPLEGGGINRACLEEQKPVSAAGEFFCFNSYIYLFILILFFSCLFPKPPPTFIKNSVGFSKVPDCIKQHQKRHRKYLQTKCEIKSEHSLWRKTLYVHVCLFLLRYFFLGGGGWGMFIPLLAILCWTQLLKNALL